MWAAFVLPARAQFICHVTHGKYIKSVVYYNFASLRCDGNTGIVGARTIPDTGSGFGRIVFLRSHDGGHTWSVQDPDLPYSKGGAIVGIDLIDSSNIVAYGTTDPGDTPYALLVRTSNGGTTWQQETVPTAYSINDVSFSNSQDGILASSGTYITSDGGARWDSVQFSSGGIESCHAYGNGMYRGFRFTTGELYTTRDRGRTFDSTGPIVTDPARRTLYYYEFCAFGAGDTMLAYGWHRLTPSSDFPCIARTIDGGKHWFSVFDDTTHSTGYVSALSDFHRDKLVAGVAGWENLALSSTDNGSTWHVDTLMSSDTEFDCFRSDGIGLNSDGELVAAYDHDILYHPAVNSLIIGRPVTSGVQAGDGGSPNLGIVPNPTTSSITIQGAPFGRTVHVLDFLGREVSVGSVPASGRLTLDLRSLPSGVYYVSDGLSQMKFVKE
ncbi:MAG: T9SS type A sorting domain-containing protein [Bacteroidota bacterium]|nr:T9SS type A sorting domain-containing protein [Bacteroidota bacterium]MDP4234733.1 T9SS type A sorting domain-containing protein [Bacteroidota bacterium]MDP4242625.1 T9SS type A sorting domain-containing protein [Bacteroidota bacterium]MDP4286813.1 T9SS type A sorting domain-containing protein [Bacteroidota bacterium]